MAAGSVVVYSKAALNLGNGSFNLGSDTFNYVLCTSSYTPAPNTDATYADVSGPELTTGGGYTSGGTALSTVTWTQATGTITFDAADVSYTSSTITAKYIVIARVASSTLASTDKLLCYCDLNSGGGSVSSSSGTFAINWNASGLFTLTHTP
jgi:hypothetical protein